MSCDKTNCVISLGLTIMDRCVECGQIERENAPVAETLPEPRKFDPTPSVSRDGGKTWRRVDDSSHDGLYSVGAGLPAATGSAAVGIARTLQRLKSKELASYVHTQGDSSQDEPREIDASFFVTCIEDEGKRREGFLLGPYATHAEALANVDRGAKLACAAHAKAHWYSFGTCSITNPTERKGMFGK